MYVPVFYADTDHKLHDDSCLLMPFFRLLFQTRVM
jgi:hypothetical protein